VPISLPTLDALRKSAWPGSLAVIGLVLTFAAPPHRTDLLILGVLALAIGLIWRPALGPLLIGAALPFWMFSRPLVGPLSVSPPGLVLLLGWLAVLVQAPRHQIPLRWPRTDYDGPLALFLLAGLPSLLVTEYPLLSARELRALILEPVLFFWLLRCLPGSPPLALSGFLLTASIAGVAAILQVTTGVGGTEAEGVRRAQAWYPSPNHFALMLGRAWPFLLAGALARAPALWFPSAIVAAAMVLTFSTGGWLGAAAAAVVAVAALGRWRLALLAAAASALGLLVVSGLAIAGALPERLNPLRQTGGFRLALWLSSLEMVRDHPLLGVGLDNFGYLYREIYLREGGAAEPNLSHPHNWILHVWLQLGLLGLIAFVWLLARCWNLARRVPLGARHRWLVAGALGSLTAMLVHGLIDNSYFLVDLAYVFWLSLAIVSEETARDRILST
jgi:O-antigen ligase